MNPFDLTGPSFLVFYWTLSIGGLLVIYWLRLGTDVEGAPTQMLSDPFLLAYLRGGHPEAIRVALLLLIEEGAVIVTGRTLARAPRADLERMAIKRKHTALEQELLFCLANRSVSIDQLIDADIGQDGCTPYRMKLEEFGYIRRRANVDRVQSAWVGVAFGLVVIAFIKLGVALSRGRTNVGFLIFSGIVAVSLVVNVGRVGDAITARGKRALEGAVALLAGTRQRMKDASAAIVADELAWVAAAFGFAIFEFSPATFSFWPALSFAWGSRYRPPEERNKSSGGSSYGSSGSSFDGGSISSCGGGGGSSCGGGGGCGGGGCGGCGGS